MEPPFNFLQDDRALAILTHAAMQTNYAADNNSNSGYDRSSGLSSLLTRADARGSSSTPISNHSAELDNNRNQVLNLPHSRTPDILNSYTAAIPSSRSMETLAFSPAQNGRQSPFLTAGYKGIGSQISQNYAQSLGILSAESYDDGRAVQHSRTMRLKPMTAPDPLMQFGITEAPEMRTDSDEMEKTSRRRKKHKIDFQHEDDEEEARKKARGRPRVDTKDETAADRRRTQIRMAQRAYRHRKETTIASLEKQVQDLRGTNEEMSNIFISLYDFAVSKGLLQREPEFGQQLQATTERFLALAKSTASDEANEDNHVDEHRKQDSKSEPESGRRTKKGRATPEKVQEQETLSSQPWGGYYAKSESPVEEIQPQYSEQSFEQRNAQRDLLVITRPTENNASFPFDLMDLQSYRVEVPPLEDSMQNFYTEAQLPLPDTHSYTEFSFARRIHRGAVERAFMLITSKDPDPKRYQEVFGFCFLYETKEAVEARIRHVMSRSAKESLQNWKAPFVHVGGSGTFYPMHESDANGDLMPKFRTGYSMGPFSPSVTPVQNNVVQGMRLNIPGYEGVFFDPNDVEGYLRGRGLEIPPAAEYITAEIDLSTLGEVGSPHSDSTITTLSPKTPRSPVDVLLDSDLSYSFDFAKPEGKAFPFPLGYSDWENNDSVMEASNVEPIFNTIQNQNTSGMGLDDSGTERPHIEKRLVTVNVKVLIDELLDHGVCLGRAPGFRPFDVNAAIIAAVRAGF